MSKYFTRALGVLFGISALGAVTTGLVFSFENTLESVFDQESSRTAQEVAVEIEKYFSVNSGELTGSEDVALEPLTKIIEDIHPRIAEGKLSVSIDGTFSDYCVTVTSPEGRQSIQGYSYTSTEGVKPTQDTESPYCNTANADFTAGTVADITPEDIEVTEGLMWGFFSSSAISVIPLLLRTLKASKEDPTSPKAIAPKEPERITSKDNWNSLISRHEAVKKEWLSYELDLVKILAYPSLTNMGLPATSEFHKNLRIANHLAPAKAVSTTASGSPFETAVINLEHSFDVMISEAKRMKWNNFNAKEQNSLRTAQKLLNLAINESASENERHIAYKQLIKELEGIISLPTNTALALEQVLPKALESGVEESETSSEAEAKYLLNSGALTNNLAKPEKLPVFTHTMK